MITIIVLTAVMISLSASAIIAVALRRVVRTNMVHIVQRRRTTVPYGTGQATGNVYYEWPSWVPYIGVNVIELPVSNFELPLVGYEAYDKDRVPFVVDVVAFFRIKDTACAAQRVSSIVEMKEQLSQIVRDAVRTVFASDVIDRIMVERAKFGAAFTDEVSGQLEEWGVESVKSMELMDVRDGDNPEHQSVAAIMAKKVSHIAMESRKEVAGNKRAAEVAEIEAQQDIELAEQEKQEKVGERTAMKKKQVGIADKQSEMAVFAAEKATREASMDVERVKLVRLAEITKDQMVVEAEQKKQTQVIVASGALEAAKLAAAGVQATGEAEGAAEQARLMAPVNSQITLAKEIGGNTGYQQYLVMVQAIAAYLSVGGKQAEALQKADVKIIANTGKPVDGMKSVMDIFSSTGGTELGVMIEAFAQSPLAKALLNKAGLSMPSASTAEIAEPGHNK